MLPTPDIFLAALGQRFDPAPGETGASFVLVDVKAAADAPPEGSARQPFSAFFREGPGVAEQRTYRLENAAMGVLDIFLVPVARDGDGVLWEAVFN